MDRDYQGGYGGGGGGGYDGGFRRAAGRSTSRAVPPKLWHDGVCFTRSIAKYK